MSKVCSLCGKCPASGQNVSHSKRRTKRRFLPNLITKRFGGRKVKICASCLRTLKKPERIKQSAEGKIEKVAEKKIAKVSKGEKVSKVEKVENVSKEEKRVGKVKKTEKVDKGGEGKKASSQK